MPASQQQTNQQQRFPSDPLLPRQTSSTSHPCLRPLYPLCITTGSLMSTGCLLGKAVLCCNSSQKAEQLEHFPWALHFDQTANHQNHTLQLNFCWGGGRVLNYFNSPPPSSQFNFCQYIQKKNHDSLVCEVGLWSCACQPEGKKEVKFLEMNK